MDQESASYWHELLGSDKAVPPDFLRPYQTFHRFLRPIFYAFASIPLRFISTVKVFGQENLPGKPPDIIAANHGSAVDFGVVAWAMGGRKDEVFPLATKFFLDNPFLRFWIKVAANAVRIDTVDDFLPTLRIAIKILKAGQAIYLHPEGLRTVDGSLLPFRPGAAVLAVESGAPLVPVYLHNTWKAMPAGSIFFRRVPISVAFGKPIEMTAYQEKLKSARAYDVYQEVTEELRKRILELRENILSHHQ